MATEKAKTMWPEFKIGSLADYHYTNQSGTFTKKSGVDEDTNDLNELLDAFNTLSFSEPLQKQCMAIVAFVMHLGNITFSSDGKDGCTINNPEIVTLCAEILQLDEKKLSRRLTHENILVVGKQVEKNLDVKKAESNRDSIAKAVYNGIFKYVVTRINHTSSPRDVSAHVLWIGTLDVFGFEIFENNSFEQFCINFCNERLQQYFNYHVLKAEQDLYLKEGLLWEPVELPDNQDCIDLVAQKPYGILAILDSACVQPKGDHKTFTTNLFKSRPHRKLRKVQNRAGGRLSGGRNVQINGFMIKHYAGDVIYNAEEFLIKNQDQNHPDTISLFGASGQEVASSMLAPRGLPDGKSSSRGHRRSSSRMTRTFQSVGTMFAESLNSLIKTLEQTNPFFIRCIKPNTLKRPKNFDKEYVRPQLRCGGLVQALKIIKCGFPVRCSYSKVFELFGSILDGQITPTNINFRDFTEACMLKLGDRLLDTDDYALGLNMVFFRPGKQAFLQAILTQDVKSITEEKIRAVRDFMCQKRVMRINGGARAFIRLRHAFARRRLLLAASVLRVTQRTLGRALSSARLKLNAAKEASERDARMKDAEYQAALQAKKDLVKLKEAKEAEKARAEALIAKEQEKQAQLADEIRRNKKGAAALLTEKKALAQELAEAKKKAHASKMELSGLRSDLQAKERDIADKQRVVDRLTKDLKGVREEVKELKQGAVVQLAETKRQLERLRAEFETERKAFDAKSNDYESRLNESADGLTRKESQLEEVKRSLAQTSGDLRAAEQRLQDASAAAQRAQQSSEEVIAAKDRKIDELKRAALVLEGQMSNDSAASHRHVSELEAIEAQLKLTIREREDEVEEGKRQLARSQQQLDALRTQSAGELRQLQDQAAAARQQAQDDVDGCNRQIRERDSKLQALQNEFDFLKSSSGSNASQLSQQILELEAEVERLRASASSMRSSKDQEISNLTSQLSTLQGQLEGANAQSRRELAAAADELKRTQTSYTAKNDELLRRIRELESELNQVKTELLMANENRKTTAEELERLQAVFAAYRLEMEEKVHDLSARLERVSLDAKSAGSSAGVERKQLLSQVHALGVELTEVRQQQRAESEESQKKIFELESALDEKTRSLSSLESSHDHEAQANARTVRNLEESLTQAQNNADTMRERFNKELAQAQADMTSLRETARDDKAAAKKREDDLSTNSRNLLSTLTRAQSETKALRDSVTDLTERLATSEKENSSRASTLRQQNLSELADFESKHKRTLNDLAAATTRLHEAEQALTSSQREKDSLESKFQKKVDRAEADSANLLAKLQSAERRRQLDVADATSSLEGQIKMYQGMVADLKADKKLQLNVVATLRQQLQEASGNVGELKSSINACNRRLDDQKQQHGNSVKTLEDRFTRERQSMRDQLNASERNELDLKNSIQELKSEVLTLRAEKDEAVNNFNSMKRELVRSQSEKDTVERNELRLLKTQADYEQKLTAANDALHAKMAEFQNGNSAVEQRAKQLEVQVVDLQRQVNNSQSELTSRERYFASELKRKEDTAEEDLRVRTQQLEQQFELKARALEQSNRAMQMELDYLKMQAEVQQRNEQEFAARRQEYEDELHQLRAAHREVQSDLSHVSASYGAFKAHTQNQLASLKSQYELDLREELSAAQRRRERDNTASPSYAGASVDDL
jgi:myosin protein heavy chain